MIAYKRRVVYVGAQRYYRISTLGISWRQARAVPASLLPVSHHVTLGIAACTLTMSSTLVEVTRVGFIGASAGCVRPQPRGLYVQPCWSRLYVQPCWSRSSRPRWTPYLGVLHPTLLDVSAVGHAW